MSGSEWLGCARREGCGRVLVSCRWDDLALALKDQRNSKAIVRCRARQNELLEKLTKQLQVILTKLNDKSLNDQTREKCPARLRAVASRFRQSLCSCGFGSIEQTGMSPRRACVRSARFGQSLPHRVEWCSVHLRSADTMAYKCHVLMPPS